MPGYQQKHFGNNFGITPIITPTGVDGTLRIRQDAQLSQLILAPNESIELEVDSKRKTFVHLVEGQTELNGVVMLEADGAKIVEEELISFNNSSDNVVKALIFDLP